MGYYVSITSSDVVIPKKNLDAALAEMKRINGPEFDNLKRGGSYGPNGTTKKWYSWMPESFDQYESLSDFLSDVGFDIEEVDGNLLITGYDDKHGNEDIFLQFLAPFIAHGSSMEWRGEEGERWRYTFEAGKMVLWEENLMWRKAEDSMLPVEEALYLNAAYG